MSQSQASLREHTALATHLQALGFVANQLRKIRTKPSAKDVYNVLGFSHRLNLDDDQLAFQQKKSRS